MLEVMRFGHPLYQLEIKLKLEESAFYGSNCSEKMDEIVKCGEAIKVARKWFEGIRTVTTKGYMFPKTTELDVVKHAELRIDENKNQLVALEKLLRGEKIDGYAREVHLHFFDAENNLYYVKNEGNHLYLPHIREECEHLLKKDSILADLGPKIMGLKEKIDHLHP